MAGLGVVFIVGGCAALIWAFGWPIRRANDTLDHLLGPPPEDDVDEFDDVDHADAAGDERDERLDESPEDAAHGPGAMWEPHADEEAAVARARTLLAGGRS